MFPGFANSVDSHVFGLNESNSFINFWLRVWGMYQHYVENILEAAQVLVDPSPPTILNLPGLRLEIYKSRIRNTKCGPTCCNAPKKVVPKFGSP